MLVNDRFRMSLTFDFCNIGSCLDDTVLLHSADNCFNIHLASSDLCFFTRYAADAISFHMPRRSARPSGSSTGCSLPVVCLGRPREYDLKVCYVSVSVRTASR